ncbi:MarR family transcriptional regulator [Nonomuraea sp. NBC_01738]|uniref:MarR family winged helix-turn-helix transcriptional regulator n=1 Tax=Nonomuraea sp. NBC_01738 TaxID=2976003 RepID=UPI002E0F3EB7|nr:MarR family transcriptional regulator [Nonomuraea sp. NBC_01738]
MAEIDSWPTGRLLSVAARLVEGRFHDFLAAHGLTHAGLIALHHLEESPLTQRDLAGLCRVTDQTMSRTIGHLRRTGHVTTDSDHRDRRRSLVTITPLGSEKLELAREAERTSEHLMGAVDEQFRQQLIKLITLA